MVYIINSKQVFEVWYIGILCLLIKMLDDILI